MKILIGQPVLEKGVAQLKELLKKHKGIDMILFPEGYLCDEKALAVGCALAKEHSTAIITSYKREGKNRAVVIGSSGDIIYERAKTLPDEKEELTMPLSFNYNKAVIGYLLCMELLKGARDLRKADANMSFVAHPIGVGMFSEEQFELWINEAKSIAKTYNTMIIGASHADGSYRNCGVSIPISYFIDCSGEAVYISKSDIRTRIINTDTKEVQIVD